MHEITPAIANRIDHGCATMATLAYEHCVEVYPEKGSWDGEPVGLRLDKILTRLRILQALERGETWQPNDDGSPRTLAGEFAKLACSVMILGDLLGAYEITPARLPTASTSLISGWGRRVGIGVRP